MQETNQESNAATKIELIKAALRQQAAMGPLSKAERRHVDDYLRRLVAAGLGDEAPENEDIELFRCRFARRLYMFVNRWHGCPELLCRRNRGCMAPYITCSNVEKLSPEEFGRRFYAVKDYFTLANKALLAEAGVAEDA